MKSLFLIISIALTGLLVSTKCYCSVQHQGADAPPDAGNSLMKKQYPGLSVSENGDLLLNGKPYRGVGVNYFNAFTRTLDEGRHDDTSYRAGFAYLKDREIPFMRFAINGYWPSNWDLYRYDRVKFFRNLDAFVNAAEEYGIGLIPSFFWHTPTVPDLVGESIDQWGNPHSETTKYMQEFVKDIVVRYRESAAIWGWEQGNEVNLMVDLPGEEAHLPPIVPSLGTPSGRSKHDKLYTQQLQTMMEEFAKEVRKYDGSRIVITGNAISRPASYHLWKENSWSKDTEGQFKEMLGIHNPDPMDVLSIHLYPAAADEGFFDGPTNLDRLIATSMDASRSHGKPLFIGEFGAQEKFFGPEVSQQRFLELLASIELHGVPLAAMWVFDYPPHDDEEGINVSLDNGPREYMLQEIMKLNGRIMKRSER